MLTELWLPALDSSLLNLKLRVYRSECQGASTSRFRARTLRRLADLSLAPPPAEHDSLFAPLLRQYSPLMHETKFFPNVRVASLYTYAAGPYLPPPSSPFTSSGARLQFFLDPTCARDPHKSETADLAVEIKVDVWATLGGLVVRYRLALVTVPFALAMLVVGLSIKLYNSGSASPSLLSLLCGRAWTSADPLPAAGSFPSFGSTLSSFSRSTLPSLLLALLALSYLQAALLSTHTSSHDRLAAVEPGHHHHSHLALPPAWIANALLGNTGSFWAPLAPFLVFASVGVVACEYWALWAVVAGSAWAIKTMQSKGPERVKAWLPCVSSTFSDAYMLVRMSLTPHRRRPQCRRASRDAPPPAHPHNGCPPPPRHLLRPVPVRLPRHRHRAPVLDDPLPRARARDVVVIDLVGRRHARRRAAPVGPLPLRLCGPRRPRHAPADQRPHSRRLGAQPRRRVARPLLVRPQRPHGLWLPRQRRGAPQRQDAAEEQWRPVRHLSLLLVALTIAPRLSR